MAPYRSTLAQLEQLDVAAVLGAQVHSRWIEEGESSSAFFLRQERKCGVDWHISVLRQGMVLLYLLPRDLCGQFQSFNSSLFSAAPVDTAAQDSLFESMESSLSEDQAEVCEGHLSMDECFAALNGMAHNKAPGIDSLPMEFYAKFLECLGCQSRPHPKLFFFYRLSFLVSAPRSYHPLAQKGGSKKLAALHTAKRRLQDRLLCTCGAPCLRSSMPW